MLAAAVNPISKTVWLQFQQGHNLILFLHMHQPEDTGHQKHRKSGKTRALKAVVACMHVPPEISENQDVQAF